MSKPEPRTRELRPLEVVPFGRWVYLVQSESRPALRHLVDFEPELDDRGEPVKGAQPYRCSCEAHFYHVARPCKHARAALAYLRPLFEHLAQFKPAAPPRAPRRDYRLQPGKKYRKP